MESFQSEKNLVGKGNEEWEDSLQSGKEAVQLVHLKKNWCPEYTGAQISNSQKSNPAQNRQMAWIHVSLK